MKLIVNLFYVKNGLKYRLFINYDFSRLKIALKPS
jgi:hypothetical protein